MAFALFAVWPYALYLYGAVYADALFVFLVLAAFVDGRLHVERREQACQCE